VSPVEGNQEGEKTAAGSNKLGDPNYGRNLKVFVVSKESNAEKMLLGANLRGELRKGTSVELRRWQKKKNTIR